ncbi:MAG TPA: response regulator [Bryobacteraceae bacterium]|nr:response regulator [Bryobacteraceae bacterium]
MAAPSHIPRSSFQILVVEDNAINRKVISIILRGAGFEVDVVSDGIEAVAAYQSTPYDLILMDLQMPRMDGWEAARQIRHLQQAQPVIVAVSADALPGVHQKCLQAGMDDYLSKPFTRNQLLAIVKSARERRPTADRGP